MGEHLVSVLSLSTCYKGALSRKDTFNFFQEIPKPGKIMAGGPKGKGGSQLLTTTVSKALKCGEPTLPHSFSLLNIYEVLPSILFNN